MATFDEAYERLVADIVTRGVLKPSRQKGSHTRSIVAGCLRVPIGQMGDGPDGTVVITGFPSLRCKRLMMVTVFHELAWFLRGSTSARELAAVGCHIWDDDAAKAKERGLDLPEDELGLIYGYQWRGLPSGDQITRALETLVADPFGRRNLVVSWNVDDLSEMALPPCHYAFQFVCTPGPEEIIVSCVVTMRSTDVGLGLPFNVVSYAMLTILMCVEASARARTRYMPGEVVVNMADCHLYDSHMGPLTEAIASAGGTRAPKVTITLPKDVSVDGFAKWGSPEFKGVIRILGDLPFKVPLTLHT